MNISVNARPRPDGSVACDVKCDGQRATLIFDGADVILVVPEPAREDT